MESAYKLHLGECLEVLRTLPDNSVDSIVTDPPYGLSKEPDMAKVLRHWLAGDDYQHKGGGFMGKTWDSFVPGPSVWRECLRVLKPGGHLLAFFGTRTQDIGTLAIRLAGFEIRDSIAWVYGSGFPKSLDVSKAIDKVRDDSEDILRVTSFMADAADRGGITRADVDAYMGTSDMGGWWLSRLQHRCQCPKWGQWLQLKALLNLNDEMDAEVWRLNGRKGQTGEAWQTAEVLSVDVRMNEASGIVSAGRDERVEVERQIKAANSDAARHWQGWGTALKPALEPITVARKPLVGTVAANVLAHGTGALNIDGCRVVTDGESTVRPESLLTSRGVKGGGYGQTTGRPQTGGTTGSDSGRWPANLIHDGSDEVVALFPDTGVSAGGGGTKAPGKNGIYGDFKGHEYGKTLGFGDSGSAARFFYCAKASRKDRNEGLDDPGAQFKRGTTLRQVENTETKGNTHPTVKPTDLMAYLCRLVTPPGGVVLDPYMGSGSTGKAAMREGFRFIGCELSPEYLAIAEARIAHELAKRDKADEQEGRKPQQELFA